jgi:hypothetical protein
MTVFRRWLGRVGYRIRQFRSLLWPQVDLELWQEALAVLPVPWRSEVDRLRASEKAHVLRLYRAIKEDPDLPAGERADLLLLALTHDLGKVIERPGLVLRIAKVLLPLPNRAHPLAGAKLLRRLGAPRALVRRVARHHEPPGDDRLLALFQAFDNRC